MKDSENLQSRIDGFLASTDLDELLETWRASQGGHHRDRRLDLIADVVTGTATEQIRVLDLCCGPGELGRRIAAHHPDIALEGADRDAFLLTFCDALNQRLGIDAMLRRTDLLDPDWASALTPGYDAIISTTALHWLGVRRLGEVFADIHDLLGPQGVFLFSEPARALPPFEAGYARWEVEEDDVYDVIGTWNAFWQIVEDGIGAGYQKKMEALPTDAIGDDGVTISTYVHLLEEAGFIDIDILQRRSRTVTIGSRRG